jgi:hypothetical protein
LECNQEDPEYISILQSSKTLLAACKNVAEPDWFLCETSNQILDRPTLATPPLSNSKSGTVFPSHNNYNADPTLVFIWNGEGL